MLSWVPLKLVLGPIEANVISERLLFQIETPPGPMPRSSEVPLCSTMYLNILIKLFPEGQWKNHQIGHWKPWVENPVQIFPWSMYALTKKDINRQMLHFPHMGNQHQTEWSLPCLNLLRFLIVLMTYFDLKLAREVLLGPTPKSLISYFFPCAKHAPFFPQFSFTRTLDFGLLVLCSPVFC